MKPENVNQEWAKKVTFDQFCKDVNIAKLRYSDMCDLYEKVTGKQPKVKKSKGEE